MTANEHQNTPQDGDQDEFATERGWAEDGANAQKRRPARFDPAPDSAEMDGNTRATAHSGDTSDGDAFSDTAEAGAAFGVTPTGASLPQGTAQTNFETPTSDADQARDGTREQDAPTAADAAHATAPAPHNTHPSTVAEATAAADQTAPFAPAGRPVFAEAAQPVETDNTVQSPNTAPQGDTGGGNGITEEPEINVAPTAIKLSDTSVAEDVAGAVIGEISGYDPNSSDQLSYSASDPRFEVVDGALKLRDDVVLNHEEIDSLQIEVTATDSAGLTLTETFDITVTDINEAPTGLTLTPERPDMPQDVPAPGDTVTLDVRLAGEAYRGDPAYEIVVDGKVVAKGKVDWSRETTTEGRYDLIGDRDAVDWRDVSVDLTLPEGGFETVEVRFPNDAYRRNVGDRNLIVDRIAIDGNAIEAESTDVHYQGGNFAGDTTSERMPWRGALEFDVTTIFDNAGPREAPDGPYVLEDTPGAVIGQLDFSDVDEGDSHSFAVSDDRFEVVDGALKLKDGISLDYETAPAVPVEVTVTDAGGAQATLQVEVTVVDVAEVPPPAVQMEPSFVARFFDMDNSIRTLSDVDFDAAPTHVDALGDVDFARTRGSFWEDGSRDTFGVQVSGQIDAPEDGVFTFSLGADDGAVLLIDGVPVIDNDGLHAFRTSEGQIELEAGPHVIEVLYFENYGHAGLRLEWDGPGLDGPELVTPGGAQAEGFVGIEGTSLDFALDLSFNGGQGTVELSGLPDGALVEMGDVSARASDGSVDLTGAGTGLLSITPPPGFQGPVDATLSATDGHGRTTEFPLEFDVVAPPWEPPASIIGDPLADDADFLDQMDLALAGDQNGDQNAADDIMQAQIEVNETENVAEAEFEVTVDL